MLNKKFGEWKKWYSGDNYSVCAQIRQMLKDTAIFYVINEARKYANTDANGNPELNDMVHGLINRTFLKTQALSIRKLYDNRDDVISLRRLLNDIESNKVYLTRQNILSALELPYDYDKGINEGRHNNDSGLMIKSAHSENVHKNIDLLTGVEYTKRQPNDMVQEHLLKKLGKRLDKCKPIVNFVNKIVAHAATQESRGKVPENDLKISLAKIHMAHCRIVKIAAYIGQYLLYEPFGPRTFLRTNQGNEFEHFEKPWVSKEDIAKLRNTWNQYEKSIERTTEKGFKWKNNP